MLFVKAFAIGLLCAVLAPIVVWAVALLAIGGSLLFGGAITGGGGVHVHFPEIYISEPEPESLVTMMLVGFAVGFLFTLGRAAFSSR